MTQLIPLVALLAQASGPGAGASGGQDLLVWAVVLLGVAVALFVIELFLPSGGLLGVLAAAAAVGGIVLMFWENTTLGIVTLIAVLAALPVAVGLALAIWPNTWFAQFLTLKMTQPSMTMAGSSAAEAAEGDEAAPPAAGPTVGQRGQTVGELRPVGTCVFDGGRYECLASRGVIDRGVEVEVVAVDGMHIKVRPVGESR